MVRFLQFVVFLLKDQANTLAQISEGGIFLINESKNSTFGEELDGRLKSVVIASCGHFADLLP